VQATGTISEPAPVATPSTPTIAGSTPPSTRESADHLRRSVIDLFSQRLNYPAIARRKGWQGTVTLRLLIEPDGRISRLHVDRTSGYPVLDRAAVKSLQLASVPQAGHWLHGRALELLVPVEYRLTGG
jgi:protein TonB